MKENSALLEWKGYKSTSQTAFHSLFNDVDFTDVTLACDEDGSALDVSASWFSSDSVHVVGENSAHVACLDPWIPVVLHCLLRILNAVEHDESVVVVLEQRPVLWEKS